MRLIDADAAVKQLRRACDGCNNAGKTIKWCPLCGVTFAVDALKKLPTVDAVPVVRCWQCSHSEVCKMDDGDVRYCHIYEMQTEDDYYCADGEMTND